MDFENDYEPIDDYESYAMRQRIQPHGRPTNDDHTGDNEGSTPA